MNHKIIIFDIDGTLLNSKKVEDKCFIKSLNNCFNIKLEENFDWAVLKNVTDWGITEEIFHQFKGFFPSNEDYHLMIKTFIEELNFELIKDKTQFSEIKGAIQFLENLKIKGYKIGIATGSWEESALLKLNSINLDIRDFAFSNSNYFKSREDILIDVIHQIDKNAPKSNVYYFGDGIWDFKTCQNLGINFIGIDNHNDGKLKNIGSKYVFENYINQKEILEILN